MNLEFQEKCDQIVALHHGDNAEMKDEDRSALIAPIMSEAEANGLNTTAMTTCVRLALMDEAGHDQWAARNELIRKWMAHRFPETA